MSSNLRRRRKSPGEPGSSPYSKEKPPDGHQSEPVVNETPQIHLWRSEIDDGVGCFQTPAPNSTGLNTDPSAFGDGSFIEQPMFLESTHLQRYSMDATALDSNMPGLSFMPPNSLEASGYTQFTPHSPGAMRIPSTVPRQRCHLEPQAPHPESFSIIPQPSTSRQVPFPPSYHQRASHRYDDVSTYTPPIPRTKRTCPGGSEYSRVSSTASAKYSPRGHTSRPPRPLPVNSRGNSGPTPSARSKRKMEADEGATDDDCTMRTNPTKKRVLEAQFGANSYSTPNFRKRLACPFYKRKSLKYANCQLRNTLNTPGQVKQHLLRAHKMPVYCPICREIFKSPEARQRCDSHINERRCLRRESPAIEGLTEDEIKALSRLQLRDKGDPVRGYTKIWESIFPDSPAPKDPYVQAGGPEYVKLVTRRSLGDIQAVGTKAILHVLIQPTFTASSPAENAMRIAQHVLHAIDMLCDRISDDAFDEESDGENEPATTPDRNRSKSHLHVVDETLRVPMAEKRHRSESRKCSPRTNAPMSKGRVGTEKKYDAGSSVSAGEGIICSRGPRTVLNTFEDDTEERGDKGGVDGQEFDHLAAMEVDGRENGYSFSKTPSQEEVGIGGLTMGQMGQVLSEDMPYYDTSLSVNR